MALTVWRMGGKSKPSGLESCHSQTSSMHLHRKKCLTRRAHCKHISYAGCSGSCICTGSSYTDMAPRRSCTDAHASAWITHSHVCTHVSVQCKQSFQPPAATGIQVFLQQRRSLLEEVDLQQRHTMNILARSTCTISSRGCKRLVLGGRGGTKALGQLCFWVERLAK